MTFQSKNASLWNIMVDKLITLISKSLIIREMRVKLTMRHPLIPFRRLLFEKKNRLTSGSQDVEKGAYCALFAGTHIGVITRKNSIQFLKFKNNPQSHFWVYISKGNEISISKRYVCFCVHWSIIPSGQDGETIEVS